MYGDLVHIDPSKERKHRRIRESFLDPGFRVAVIGVVAQLLGVLRDLQQAGRYLLDSLGPEKVAEIEENFEK
jgi:hypothetical protein